MSWQGLPDPMEKGFEKLCDALRIKWERDDHRSGLDYWLPELRVYVEVKRFHSPRIADQLSRRSDVIAIQGMNALDAFRKMVRAP
jgi:hypothetical protein